MLLYLDYVVIPPSPCMVQNGVFDHKHHYSKLWLGGARSSRAWQHFYYMPRYFEKGNFTPRKGWRIYIFLCNCGHILTRYVVIFILCSYILTMQLCISSQCSYILSLKLSLVFDREHRCGQWNRKVCCSTFLILVSPVILIKFSVLTGPNCLNSYICC